MPRSSRATEPFRAPGRLPAPRTSFVGREAELDKVAGLLDRHRLVTVSGPGGSGKTRLALELGRRVIGRFADGVTWVDLSGVDQGALVPATIAAAVGVQERAGDSMLGSLVTGLSARQVLVVLDNCEQIADAVAETCERLLADCDDLWILATSTRALKVQGEARFRVPPLPVPARGGSPAEVGASEAVALFVDRASAVDPDFALTADTEEAVAEIVRRLDGMPLAVELAAARVSTLGISELRAGLDDRFTVLVENSRGAPVRQRSLLAALDWSYRLLPETDQGVYRRLAVFAGPFTLAAATAVCGPRARDVVPHLVDCSLLVPPMAGIDGRSRYRMLETMRAHADRLLAGEERAEAANGLMHWTVTQPFDLQAPYDFTDHDFATLAWVDAEQDNLRRAIDWAAVHDSMARLRLVVVMGPWYRQRGWYGEGMVALGEALAGCRDRTPELASAAEYWLGDLAGTAGTPHGGSPGAFGELEPVRRCRSWTPGSVDPHRAAGRHRFPGFYPGPSHRRTAWTDALTHPGRHDGRTDPEAHRTTGVEDARCQINEPTTCHPYSAGKPVPHASQTVGRSASLSRPHCWHTRWAQQAESPAGSAVLAGSRRSANCSPGLPMLVIRHLLAQIAEP